MKLGYFLSCEEFGPKDLIDQAVMAKEAGFSRLWISDHFHPWNGEQGNSPFVWSMIGAISQVVDLPITTGVTCPTIRIHPGIVAQAAATSAVLTGGRFSLGVGSGEALNEHIFGAPWPTVDVRLEMLEEAVEVMRALWTGEMVRHRGTHYTVDDARLYTLPESPPPVLVSAFGPKAAALAGKIGDGLCAVSPDGEIVQAFREAGGAGKLVQGGAKVCFGPDKDKARATAHRLWANDALPGELAQVLPTPAHFEQASTLVTEDMIADAIPCGPDIDKALEAFAKYADAGYDELYVQQMGSDQKQFFEAYADKVVPHFS